MSGPTVRELLAALDDIMQGRRIPPDAEFWLKIYREERAQRCRWCGQPTHKKEDLCPGMDNLFGL